MKKLLSVVALSVLLVTQASAQVQNLPIGPGAGSGGGGSGSLNAGVSPITGTCTSGYLLYNNAGVLGCQAAGGSGLTVGTTTITSGTSGYIEYNNAGVLGELATTGSGNVVLNTSPTITTPTISGALTTNGIISGATSFTGPAAASTILNAGPGQPINFGVNSIYYWNLSAPSLKPNVDNAVNLGSSVFRVATGYFVNLGASATPITNAYIAGTTAGGAATAGQLGEIISSSISSASAVSQPTSGTAITITSVALTAGDWDCEGSAITKPAASTTTSVFTAGMNTTAATLPTAPAGGYFSTVATPGAAVAETAPLVRQQYNSSSSATVYLVGNATFAASTMSLYGQISCRRVR